MFDLNYSSFIVPAIVLVILIVNMYSNYSNEKERDIFIKNLKVGDNITIINSIVCNIEEIYDDYCLVKSGNLYFKVLKSSIDISGNIKSESLKSSDNINTSFNN